VSPTHLQEAKAVRIREVMSARPIMVSDHEPPGDLSRLMEAGGVHHLPVVEGGRLVGVWTATPNGPLVLVGPDRVHQTDPDTDAAEAIEALLSDAEVVFVWDSGVPAGILTRSDVMAMVRAALGRGIGRRHPKPLVLRLAGPAGAGKTTLLVRTLPLLGRLDTAIVQANCVEAREAGTLAGARAVDDPHAHWRAGLKRATERLSDAQLIFVEDRDAPIDLSHGIGEDAQVAVVPVGEVDELSHGALGDAQALVVTRVDELTGDRDVRLDAIRERFARIPVFPVAAGHDDRGLDAWVRWIEAQVLSRRG
jgi:Ni2+-binding GTPase involved in maturation of urease and hydrogenase